MDCCLEPLGALPELDFCARQQWQTSSSFCDLEMTDSGSGSWLACDLLLEPEEEEYSSKLLAQDFCLAQPVHTTTISDFGQGLYSGSPCAAAVLCSPFGAQQQPATSLQRASPATSVGTLDAMDSLAALTPPMPSSPAVTASAACEQQCSQLGAASSRAATPEPDWADEEAVQLAGLALHLAQGDANSAMAHLLSWAAQK